jgi:hypothetical protein
MWVLVEEGVEVLEEVLPVRGKLLDDAWDLCAGIDIASVVSGGAAHGYGVGMIDEQVDGGAVGRGMRQP